MYVIEATRANGVDLSTWTDVSTLPDADVVIHTAGRTHVANASDSPLAFYRDNVVTTLNLLELARQRRSLFILAGSYVYGTPRYLPVDESHPLGACSPYMS